VKKIHLLSFYVTLILVTQANQIDIGIFEALTPPKKIEVRIRPDFNISSIQTITAILYTVRWDDPSVTITTQYIYPFFVTPQGAPVLNNGYYYQVFASLPMNAVAMNANQEYLISSFTYTNGTCANFEVIENEWTLLHNGDVYLELIGLEVTGIIYRSDVLLGSIGGNLTGNDTVYLGNSTGTMTLSNYNGSIVTWQRKVNEGSWENIPGTTGIAFYSEIPSALGDCYYRAYIQKGTCPTVYSDILHLAVVAEINMNLKVFLEGAFQDTEMLNKLRELGLIPSSQPYSNPPWNYNGTESVIDIPANAVDWVLIELRESEGDASTATSDKSIQRWAAFLMKDGSIKDINGVQNLNVVLSSHDNLYIVVFHRNHLQVISAIPLSIVNGICFYNFSSGENQVLGGNLGHKEIAPGIWGMIAGDANSDGNIGIEDKQVYWNPNAGFKVYLTSDFSMDSQINNKDKSDLWYPNQGFNSQVPD